MKHTIRIMATVTITFLLMFATSALLSLPWINFHWVRQALVLLLMLLQLVSGAAMLVQVAKELILKLGTDEKN